ncbi:MAG: hypothetical protein KAT58_00475 [candidate division Zixibacteria bacterium]|nr:hypothetical protein [candidate division Zixibacteria bacterium]
MLSERKIICSSCKKEIEVPEKITKNSGCPECDAPLKCCYNCRFYDREAHQKCREPQAEWVRYKEKANFCSYFVPRLVEEKKRIIEKPQPKRDNRSKPTLDGNSRKDKRKSAWDSLFKE